MKRPLILDRRQEVANLLHGTFGPNAVKYFPQVICRVCGMKMFGVGPLLFASEWVDVCECKVTEAQMFESPEIGFIPDGCCFVFREEVL